MSIESMYDNNENKALSQYAVRRSEIKVIHGTFVEELKCKICNVDLTHEWLGGDYTLLMCEKKECWDELNKRHERP